MYMLFQFSLIDKCCMHVCRQAGLKINLEVYSVTIIMVMENQQFFLLKMLHSFIIINDAIKD